MHKINIIFIALFLLLFTNCEEKTTKKNTLPIENTTHTLNTDRPITVHEIPHQKSKPMGILEKTFNIYDINNKKYTVNISNRKVTFKENTKPLKLITFFASWCPPCVHNITYMNDLYSKYHQDMLLTGILVNDTMNPEMLTSFLQKYPIKYYLSISQQNNDFVTLIAKTLNLSSNFTIPLTVMYLEGEYFTHYEGAVPIEMMEYDIDQALKTLKQTR